MKTKSKPRTKIPMLRASFALLRNDDAKDYSLYATKLQGIIFEIKEEIKKMIDQLEDQEGNARRQDYNNDYWKGARYELHEILNLMEEKTKWLVN